METQDEKRREDGRRGRVVRRGEKGQAGERREASMALPATPDLFSCFILILTIAFPDGSCCSAYCPARGQKPWGNLPSSAGVCSMAGDPLSRHSEIPLEQIVIAGAVYQVPIRKCLLFTQAL